MAFARLPAPPPTSGAPEESDQALGTLLLPRLLEHGAALLARYARGVADGADRRLLMMTIAEVLLEVRSRHTLADGRVDWSGRSPTYRAAVSGMYQHAGIMNLEERDRVQSALRYHVGNLLRDRVGADDLHAVGLSARSPQDRLREVRDLVAQVSRLADGGAVDGPCLVRVAAGLVERVDAADLRDADDRARADVGRDLRALASHCLALLDHLDRARLAG